MNTKKILKNELTGWKNWEITWLSIACITIVSLSIYWNDTLLGIVSAITGVICVICTGKGKLSAYLFGLINCICYAIISYNSTFYGETMLNVVYYIPMQFVGFYTWSKNMNSETNEVIKKNMDVKYKLLTCVSIVLGTIAYGFVLKHLGDISPFIDAFTTITSIAAMIVSVKMYAEQWWIWVIVNIFSVYMWYGDFVRGNDNIATLLMWSIYLVNAIIMLVKWEKEARRS